MPSNQQQPIGMYNGRIGRLGYLVGLIYLIPVLIIVSMVMALVFGHTTGQTYNLVESLIVLIMAPLSFSLVIRRWHDLGSSGWMSLLLFVPLVDLVVVLILLFAPSAVDTNKYGKKSAIGLTPKKVFGLAK